MDMELPGNRSEKISYSFTDFPIYMGRTFVGDRPSNAEPAHFHDDIELVAVRSGELSYNVNGEIAVLKSGEGIIINSRQMHFCCGGEKGGDYIKILLNPMLLCSITAYERDFLIPEIKRGAAYITLRQSVPWHAEIIETAAWLYAARGTKTAPLKGQAALAYILSLVIENMPPTDSAGGSENGDLMIIRNMVSFIQRRYDDKITLADIAASGAVGQSKCCKLFARYLAQTPNSYLNRYRLSKSTELLSSTNLSVTQIAEATGFGGASYYAETFRKCYGKSPTEYRSGLVSKKQKST